MELLHQENGQEMTGAEHVAFLEDIFVLSDDPDEEEDNIFEIVGMVKDPPRKSEEFSNEAMVSSPIPRTRKVLRLMSSVKTIC